MHSSSDTPQLDENNVYVVVACVKCGKRYAGLPDETEPGKWNVYDADTRRLSHIVTGLRGNVLMCLRGHQLNYIPEFETAVVLKDGRWLFTQLPAWLRDASR